MDKYITKANALIKANFRIYGVGNFDLSPKEYALIIKYLEEEDYSSLKKLYEELEGQRLG